jgi:hypothetical protein
MQKNLTYKMQIFKILKFLKFRTRFSRNFAITTDVAPNKRAQDWSLSFLLSYDMYIQIDDFYGASGVSKIKMPKKLNLARYGFGFRCLTRFLRLWNGNFCKQTCLDWPWNRERIILSGYRAQIVAQMFEIWHVTDGGGSYTGKIFKILKCSNFKCYFLNFFV